MDPGRGGPRGYRSSRDQDSCHEHEETLVQSQPLVILLPNEVELR